MVSLGERMKLYEQRYSVNIKPYESFIVRLDGHNFSKLTRDFNKPFDLNFIKSMHETIKDLLDEFNPSTVYSHSDEITMIFPKRCLLNDYNTNKNYYHIFNGKIQKILSIISSFTSTRLNYHLYKFVNPADYKPNVIRLIDYHSFTFDARILSFDETLDYEILNHQIWRSVKDCYRNAAQSYGYCYFSSKEIFKKNTGQIIEMLKNKGVDWGTVPNYIKNGIYCKKQSYELDPGVIRTRIVSIVRKIDFSDENLDFLFSKYLTGVFNEPLSL
jgi:tRNA(His) guanylyltransferase